MIAEAFLICALSVPASFSRNHNLTDDDAMAFRAITEPIRIHGNPSAPIVFAYNYYRLAEKLREQGLRTYSMTVELSGGHLRGHIQGFPFLPGSLGAVVVLQRITYAEIFEVMDAVALHGVVMIKWADLPHLSEVILFGMGFRKTHIQWHDHDIWRRVEMKQTLPGDSYGYEAFNQKKVLHPRWVIHRKILTSA